MDIIDSQLYFHIVIRPRQADNHTYYVTCDYDNSQASHDNGEELLLLVQLAG